MCTLIPATLVKDFELAKGDPRVRCGYDSPMDWPLDRQVMVRIVWAEGRNGYSPSNQSQNVTNATIDGRSATTWTNDISDLKSFVVAVNFADGVLAMTYTSRTAGDADNKKVMLAWAEGASKAIRNGTPIEGVASAPPTTTPLQIPKGQRGWPGNICDVLPADLVNSMELTSRGYEDLTCRLVRKDGDIQTQIEFNKSIVPVNPKDPSDGEGVEVQDHIFDSRTGYSFIRNGTTADDYSTRVFVVFATDAKTTAEVQVWVSSVGDQKVDPVRVRADAVALAKEIAPHLPLP